jgi:sugar phosphate isomerase/epimerase
MPQPRIGLSMLYMLSESFKKMTTHLVKVDVSFIEIVDDGTHALDKTRVAALSRIAKSKEINYSVHAPFADINIASPSKAMLNASLKRLKLSMKYARDLDAYLWVFHPGGKSGISAFYPGAEWQQNLQSILDLHKCASDLGLRIAMENLPEKYNFLMKTPQDFIQFYSQTGLENIGVVLDTGHANLEGQIQPFLDLIPKKIAHVHISDNHGETDEHLGLGDGSIDWKQFAKSLRAIGFSGTVLTESVFNTEETLRKLKELFS